MKNFSLPSLLIGLVIGVVVAAGAMAVAGNTTDNSDLQGRFGSVPDFDEIKEIDPDVLGGWSGGDCEVTNCDLLVEIEDIQDSFASWTLPTLLVEENSQRSHYAGYVIDEVTGRSSWTLADLAQRQYDQGYTWKESTIDGVIGTEYGYRSSWTLTNLADLIHNTCN